MKSIFNIAKMTFFEIQREKFFLVITSVGFLLGFFSLLLGELSLNEKNKIIFDVTLAVSQVLSVLLGIVLSSQIIQKEIEKQTLLLILSKPIERYHFYFGKLLGVILVVGILSSTLSMFSIFLTQRFDLVFETTIAWLAIYAEVSILSLLACFFSLSMRGLLAVSLTIAIFLLGHWIPDLQFFAKSSNNPNLIAISQALEWVIPQFYLFNFKSFFLLENQIPSNYILWLFVHTSFWIFLILYFSVRTFNKKDFV